jgi:hypothetical protein
VRCAFPDCRQKLTLVPAEEGAASGSAEPVVVGEEAHIVAEEDNGPRGNPAMPIPERNAYPNRVLLCGTHHRLIDKDHGVHFAVTQLHRLKADHEAWVDHLLSGTQTEAETHARKRQELLLEGASASRGRLVARWVAAGVSPELALTLADDDTVGAPERLGRTLPATGLAVLAGDFGSGKSVTGERIYLADNAAAAADETAPLPLHLLAKSVTGPLLDTVRAAVDRLGNPARRGLRLVLDGLDEPGQARAAELLDEARALVFTWPRTRVVITARPGLPLHKEEFTLAYPPLSEEEAVRLAEGLGGQSSLLWGQSEPIRQMLHLPLFLIVAALRQQAGAEVPRSRGTFLRALVDAALDRNSRPTERSQAALESLAWLTVDSGGPMAAAELGDNATWKVLETRLVIREGGLLRFALPVVEQYFAAQPLLEHGLTEFDLEDLTVLDRWRDTLTLAVTIGSWQQVRRLLDGLAARQPGVAAWVVANAVPQPTSEPSTGLPSDVECAWRIHSALTAWADALAPAGNHLGLTDSQGRVRTVGAGTDSGVTAGLRMDDNHGVDAVRFPRLDPRTGIAADGSRWGLFRSAHVPGEYLAWPWQWALDWVTATLEAALRAKAFPLPDSTPFRDERRWQLAKALSGTSGNLLHAPIDGDNLRRTAAEVLGQLDERGIAHYQVLHSGRKITVFGRDELARLVAGLEGGGTILAEDRKLHRQYPVPDRRSAGLVRELYSDEALRTLIEQVYTNALCIYRDLIDVWFPKLAPTLGLASFMPILIRGQLLASVHSEHDSQPHLTYHMTPLPLTESPRAEIELVTEPEAFLEFDPQRARAQFLQLRQQIASLHPGAEGWAAPQAASTTGSLWKDTPATSLAYRWLWEDLRRLRLVRQNPPMGDD